MRPQGCLSECEMNEITLGEAAATTMRNVSHTPKPFGATGIITVSEGDQCLTERQYKRIIGVQGRVVACLNVRKRAQDVLCCRSTTRGGKRHCRVCNIEVPHTRKCLRLPPVSQYLPAFVHPNISKL